MGHYIYVILVGAICGWLAGKLMKGKGYGLMMNIVLGILGSYVGSWAFGLLNIPLISSFIGKIITGLLGSVIILYVADWFNKK